MGIGHSIQVEAGVLKRRSSPALRCDVQHVAGGLSLLGGPVGPTDWLAGSSEAVHAVVSFLSLGLKDVNVGMVVPAAAAHNPVHAANNATNCALLKQWLVASERSLCNIYIVPSGARVVVYVAALPPHQADGSLTVVVTTVAALGEAHKRKAQRLQLKATRDAGLLGLMQLLACLKSDGVVKGADPRFRASTLMAVDVLFSELLSGNLTARHFVDALALCLSAGALKTVLVPLTTEVANYRKALASLGQEHSSHVLAEVASYRQVLLTLAQQQQNL